MMKMRNGLTVIETPQSAASRALARLDRRLPSPMAVLQVVGRTLICWQRRINDRRKLAEMDSDLLKDIGVSRAEALNEADKPFWKS